MSRFGLGFTGGLTGNDAFTKILLHMDGSNGGTTFTDSNVGGSAHTWTAHTATTSTTQSKFGGTSLSVGSTGWIDTPDSSDFTLGSGDFTVDCWFYVSGGSGTERYICGQENSAGATANQSIGLKLGTGNTLVGEVAVATITRITGLTAITTTGWHHAAFVRSGNLLMLFLDGAADAANVSFSSTVNDSPNAFSVGRLGEFSTLKWNGFIDEFRLSVGVARWTSGFTPPVAPYGP